MTKRPKPKARKPARLLTDREDLTALVVQEDESEKVVLRITMDVEVSKRDYGRDKFNDQVVNLAKDMDEYLDMAEVKVVALFTEEVLR